MKVYGFCVADIDQIKNIVEDENDCEETNSPAELYLTSEEARTAARNFVIEACEYAGTFLNIYGHLSSSEEIIKEWNRLSLNNGGQEFICLFQTELKLENNSG